MSSSLFSRRQDSSPRREAITVTGPKGSGKVITRPGESAAALEARIDEARRGLGAS